MKLRIGLIGLGDLWMTRYRPALRMLDDRFDVRAVYSTISKLAESTASEFQADPVDGYRSLVCRCDIDAVLILKPCWLGWLPALAACQAGKAVYWGAGLEIDADRAKTVCETIEQSGISFMAELPRRFAPATLRLKELIATRLGKPRLIRVHHQVVADESHGTRTKQRSQESEFVELVDWCRYVVDRSPQAVTSICQGTTYQTIALEYDRRRDSEPATAKADNTLAEITCDRGLATRWSEAANFRPPASMKVYCENGVAFLDLPSTLVWFDDAGRHVESLETESPIGERMLRQFHRSVTSLVRDLGGLVDTCEAATIVQAARDSQESGTRVSIDL